MQAWIVRRDGEPADVLALEDVPEPRAEGLAGLKLDLAGWITEPASLGAALDADAEAAERARYAQRAAARRTRTGCCCACTSPRSRCRT